MKSEARGQESEENGFGQIECDGFQIINSLANQVECDLFCGELTPLFEQQQKSAKSKIGGVRNLLRTNDRVSEFAKSSKMAETLKGIARLPFFPVRAIFFDKTPDANWLVPWHQDLAIAVAGRIETTGFTGWSMKDNTLHVHPPQEILESMVTLRLHLDDCDASNGPLKVIPRSHRSGKLDALKISELTKSKSAYLCEVRKGDAMFMRPLLLHASAPAENPQHRRVLHIEFAAQELPNGLKWFDC